MQRSRHCVPVSYALELVRYIHQNPLKVGLVENLQKYNWSTHKIYLSTAKKWDWVYKDYILNLFSKSNQESIRLYKRFVSHEILKETNKIFAGKKLPTALGSKSFISRIKNKFFNPDDFEDILETKNLAPDTDKIMYHVYVKHTMVRNLYCIYPEEVALMNQEMSVSI